MRNLEMIREPIAWGTIECMAHVERRTNILAQVINWQVIHWDVDLRGKDTQNRR